MKKRNQIEKCLNNTIESLKSVLKDLNKDESDITNFCDNKYDPEMSEEERKIYEEKYKKVEPYPLNSRGDWIRLWLSSYKEQQIRSIFFPLVMFLLNDENKDQSQFNQYNRYKIFDSLRDISESILTKPLKDDVDTQEKLIEVLSKIYPKNINIFWEIVNDLQDVFHVDLNERESFEKFIQEKQEEFKNALADIKDKYEYDFKKLLGYYVNKQDAYYSSLINEIFYMLHGTNPCYLNRDVLKSISCKIKLLLEDKNKEHREILQNLYNDINKLM